MKKEKKVNLNRWSARDVIGFLTAALSFLIVDRFWGLSSWRHGLLVVVVYIILITIIHVGRNDLDKKN